MLSAEEIIEKLKLEPHPAEGGFFKETYRSSEKISSNNLPKRYGSDRLFGTAIYYMLTPESFSAMHRLLTDEIFHFYLGDPVTLLLLYPDGSSEVVTLGPDILSSQKVQFTVKRGSWMGAFLNDGGKYGLMGTTMAPGFEYDDYINDGIEELADKYPERKELIERLIRK
jgi:uncharacterized protein